MVIHFDDNVENSMFGVSVSTHYILETQTLVGVLLDTRMYY